MFYKKTIKQKAEKVRNITIKLGYANAKIYKCGCEVPECFKSFGSNKEDKPKCDKCNQQMELKRHISFVDCPGHDILMATMLTGAAVMDAALLLIAANMSCPQPQTSEHLAAVEIMQLDRIIILQNKIDLIFDKPNSAQTNYDQIKGFIKGTKAENSPIVPISAQFRHNVDALLYYLVEYIPIPKRNLRTAPQMIVIRSFDVNKPGCEVSELRGGVAGGSIIQGILRIGDEIEVRPGRIMKDPETGSLQCKPILSKVITLFAENNSLLYAIPGGLIAVGTQMDPSLTKGDELVGSVIGYPGQLPDVYEELEIQYYLLRRLVGVRSEVDAEGDNKVSKIATREVLMINVGSTSCGGKVLATNSKLSTAKIVLLKPVCTRLDEKVAISRKIANNWRLIGWGTIKGGKVLLETE